MKLLIKEKVVPIAVIMVSITVTAWLFFDFALISVGLLGMVPVALRKKRQEAVRRKKGELNLAFKDALVCLENGLAVGYSPESSVREAVKSLEQLYGAEHEIVLEFRRMTKQLHLGRSLEQVFTEFGERSGVEDIRQLADIFSVVKRTGGNLGQVLRQTGSVLQDKIDLKRELHTAIAAKQMEFHMMGLVPYGILLYLKLCAPGMSAGLYGNAFGIGFMSVVFVLYQVLKALGEWIIRGEIGKLEGE